MSREIKFRGLTKDGEWLYGSLSMGGDSAFIEPSDRTTFCRRQVLPETVGQFTGRFDDDDKEIYTGDKASLCTNIGDIIGVCEYDNILTQFIWVTDQDGVYFLSGVDAKIIGTIHDKELLNDND